MEHLKNKSEHNLQAAEFLVKKEFYTSVVHCAYYSCYQLMLYIKLKEKQHINSILKKIYKEENKKPKVEKRKGSHEILINAIYAYLLEKREKDVQLFNRIILNLKDLRTKADYSDEPIDEYLSYYSIEQSKSIQNILKEYI